MHCHLAEYDVTINNRSNDNIIMIVIIIYSKNNIQ